MRNLFTSVLLFICVLCTSLSTAYTQKLLVGQQLLVQTWRPGDKAPVRVVIGNGSQPPQGPFTEDETDFRFSNSFYNPGVDLGEEANEVRLVLGMKERDTHRLWLALPEVYAEGIDTMGARDLEETEVRDWLEKYRRALEERNVKKLVELGIYSGQEASEVEQILSRYRDLRVVVRNVVVSPTEEQGSATVTFLREDRINGVPGLPVNVTFSIERGAEGQIIVTARKYISSQDLTGPE